MNCAGCEYPIEGPAFVTVTGELVCLNCRMLIVQGSKDHPYIGLLFALIVVAALIFDLWLYL